MAAFTNHGHQYEVHLGARLATGATSEVFAATGDPILASRRDLGDDGPVSMSLVVKRSSAQAFNAVLLSEAAILRRLSGPGHGLVVRLLGDYDQGQRRHLALHPRAQGTVEDRIRGRQHWGEDSDEGRRELEGTAGIVAMAARALSFCQSRKVLHQDVSTRNLALRSSGKILLIDFGWSGVLGEEEDHGDTVPGSPGYHSVDLLYGSTTDRSKADMWSLGAVLGSCIDGRSPFGDREEDTREHQFSSELEQEDVAYRKQQLSRISRVMGPPTADDVAEMAPRQPNLATDEAAGGKAQERTLQELYDRRCSDQNVRETFLELLNGLLAYAPSARWGPWRVVHRLAPLLPQAERTRFLGHLNPDEEERMRAELETAQANELMDWL